MSIGEIIKRQREFIGMSQDELATKLGYKSRASINKIEKNKTDIPQSKIVAFSQALKTTPAYLMGWVNHPAEIDHTESLAYKLKYLRGNQSEQSVCDKIGVPLDDYIRYEKGIKLPTYKDLIKISELYNVEVEYLSRGELTDAKRAQLDALLKALHDNGIDENSDPEEIGRFANMILAAYNFKSNKTKGDI